MKEEIRQIIENEELVVKEYIIELHNLNQKWIKSHSTFKYIAFLKFYVKNKIQLIKKIKEILEVKE